tara:strand:- start:344 stop:1174 length:831 start_codon:yes stop_codon:yes gene_type:complete
LKNNFESYLNQYLINIDENTIRIVKSRDELVSEIVEKLELDEKKVSEEFTFFKKRLNKEIFLSGWYVRYSNNFVKQVLHETIVFERFMEGDRIERIIEVNNRFVKKQLVESIQSLEWDQFERFCYELFVDPRLPFFHSVTQTGAGADGGIDLKGKMLYEPATLKGGFTFPTFKSKMIPFGAQIKKEKKKVGRPVIAQLRGDLESGYRGMVISSNGFSSDAIVFAQKHEIILLSIDSNIEEVASIVDIMVQQNIGIESNELKIFRNTGFLRELGFDY